MFDNAIENNIQVIKKIHIMVYVSHDKTIEITITNPISSAVNMKALHNKGTTKEGHLGVGLANIHEINKYDNLLWNYHIKNNCFKATIMILN